MPARCNVADFLRRHAAERPDAPALRVPARAYRTEAPRWDGWSFAELDRRSDAYARGLCAVGLRPGDRTLVLFRPSLAFYAALFGLFKAGAVPVLLDPGMGLKNLMICIERTRPRAMLAAPLVQAIATFWRRPFASVELKITAGPRLFWGGHRLRDCALEGEQPFPIARRDPGDDAAIVFTSGSTGPAKGVASKHGMFRAQVESLRQMLGFEPGLQDVQCFAAFAIFDLCMGMCAILPRMDLSRPATADPRDILAALTTFEPEVAFGSPIVWQHLARHCLAHGRTIPGLRKAITVGAPIPAYLHRRLREILPEGCQVHTPYGATEGLPITHIATDAILGTGPEDPGTWARTAAGEGTCVGHPAPGATLRIAPITDDPIPTWEEDLALPTGAIGEVVVGGEQVSPEYKDAPQANALAKIAHGDQVLHRMGDLGYLDDEGRLWFCGRKAHRLLTEEGMVPAVPVEGVFNEHPAVFRSALVGVGPPGRQVPVLCVELEPGATWSDQLEEELRALARPTRWADRVQRFLPCRSFPTDPRHNSKIRREELRELATRRCPDLVRELAPR